MLLCSFDRLVLCVVVVAAVAGLVDLFVGTFGNSVVLCHTADGPDGWSGFHLVERLFGSCGTWGLGRVVLCYAVEGLHGWSFLGSCGAQGLGMVVLRFAVAGCYG